MAPTSLNYTCLRPCKRSFESPRGLTLHQGKCRIYRNITEADYTEAVEVLEVGETEAITAKRRKFGEHVILNPPADTSAHGGVWFGPGSTDEVQRIQCPVQHPLQHVNTDGQTKSPAGAVVSACGIMPPEGALGQVESLVESLNVEEPTPVYVPEELGRGKRKKKRPSRYVDPLPEPPGPLNEGALRDRPGQIEVRWRTAPNANGAFREYESRPTFVPDEYSLGPELPDVDKALAPLANTSTIDENNQPVNWFAPFENATCFRLLHWFWVGSQTKSLADLQALADTVFKAPDFAKDDLEKFSAKSENRKLDEWIENLNGTSSSLNSNDGWQESSVSIPLPDGRKYGTEGDAPRFTVAGLHHRSLTAVIKAAFQSEGARRFHYTPFEQYWQPKKGKPPERVYDEAYSSDVWLKYQKEVESLPRNPEELCERAIAGLMFWSDSTQLANFGTASLWPLYLFFGNQSKYERSRPSLHACHHVAYLPKLPDTLAEKFKELTGGKMSDDNLALCKRELMHALLSKIFDSDFTKAYMEGILITCADGRNRRIYPRIFSYSGDYPEKCLLSGIRQLAMCPCPRCLVLKSQTHQLGTQTNETVVSNNQREDSDVQRAQILRSRGLIYQEGRAVNGNGVAGELSSKSLVPIIGAFSTFIGTVRCQIPSLTFNFFTIFVSDFLHEYELGVWKMTFIHLIRILVACGQQFVVSLNERYRAIATFNRDTIRKFSNDASSMKRLAARDYEDLLLCSMPVFDGLLPEEHNTVVQDLLFALLAFHALAKLRVHTDSTLELLQEAKRNLGVELRSFQKITCTAYETHELPAERARRERREALKLAKAKRNALAAELEVQVQPEVELHKSMNTIPLVAASNPLMPSGCCDELQRMQGSEGLVGQEIQQINDSDKISNAAEEPLQTSASGLGSVQPTASSTAQLPVPEEQLGEESVQAGEHETVEAGTQQVEGNGGNDLRKNKKKEGQRKKFNLNTFKIHALDHYINDIRQFGSLDSYSTQRGELEHRTVKTFYARTNKQNAAKQMTRIERRQHFLRVISTHELDEKVKNKSEDTTNQGKEELLPYNKLEDHHHISLSRNDSVFLGAWLREHAYDRATKGFRQALKNHLLSRLIHWQTSGEECEFSDVDRNTLHLEYDRIYRHKVLRVNYTTYDGRRCQDSINLSTHSDIMIFARCEEDEEAVNEHPYWYARIIGIYHAYVRHTGPKAISDGVPQKMEFLWVRWLGTTLDIPNGWAINRLHAISFVPETDPNAFGFVDPRQVVRGVHLLPAFRYGKTKCLLKGPSIARHTSHKEEDWAYYYVNSFVDRDMFMRYVGTGIGHSLLKLGSSGSSALTRHWKSPQDELEDESTTIENTVDPESETDSEDDIDSSIDSDIEQ